MSYKNTKEGYGLLAKSLHWGMAFMLISMVAVGLYMSDLPRGDAKSDIIRLHASFGLLVGTLMVLRFVWKMVDTSPEPASEVAWQVWLAKLVHFALYAVVVFQVFTGSMSLMTVGWNLPFFELFSIPTPFARDMDLHHFWEELHVINWYVFGGLMLVHLMAPVYHVLFSDKIIKNRML